LDIGLSQNKETLIPLTYPQGRTESSGGSGRTVRKQTLVREKGHRTVGFRDLGLGLKVPVNQLCDLWVSVYLSV
jgi:hypothetical protein